MGKVINLGRSVRREPLAYANGADPEKGILKVVVRRPKSDTQVLDYDRLPLLILFAHDIIDHITDYFTLMRLSRTCKLLHDIVASRHSMRGQLFDQMEVHLSPSLLPWDHHGYPDDSICRFVQQERDRPFYWEKARNYFARNSRESLIRELPNVHLIKYNGLDFGDVMQALYLPCYDCSKIKPRDQFFEHYRTKHLTLVGCQARLRACIDCLFARFPKPEQGRLDDWEPTTLIPLNRRTQLIVGDWHVYLRDMPKGTTGFRQICQNCRTISWERTRPRKKHEIRKVCEECFSNDLGAVHLGVPKHRGRSHSRSSSTADRDDAEDGGGGSSGDGGGNDRNEEEEAQVIGGFEVDGTDHLTTTEIAHQKGGSRFDLLPDE